MKKTRLAVLSSVFAAIICVSTLIIQIPIPATHGYINPGDCFVIMAGIILGPVYGALAAGIGSALADLIAGYAVYSPASFAIKAIMAVAAFFIAGKSKRPVRIALAAFAAEIIMAAGYFLYEFFALGYGAAAAAGIPMNLIQGAAGIILSVTLLVTINKNEKLRNIIYGREI